MTNICNVKVVHIRPQYQNLKQWCEDKDNVYIARKGIVFVPTGPLTTERYPSEDSVWANPFKIGKDLTRDDCCAKYQEYISNRLEREPLLVKELLKLKGKNLGCWCVPERCHGEILLELIEKYDK
jgi:hypothetical protein